MVKRKTIPMDEGDPMKNTSVTCGYSIVPIICSITLGSIMVLTLILLGVVRRLQGEMPLMANCSAVIAAMCQRPDEDVDAARLPVQWGSVRDGGENGEEGGIGHCCFSSKEVGRPVEGRLYR